VFRWLVSYVGVPFLDLATWLLAQQVVIITLIVICPIS